jgi:transposase
MAVELYVSGLSLNAVAKHLGLSRHVGKAAVDKAGVELRDRYAK